MGKRWCEIVCGLWACIVLLLAVAAEGNVPRLEHPRPDLRRDDWLNLNGNWQFRFDPHDRGGKENWQKGDQTFDRQIVVPFCWQSPLSTVADTSGQKIGWYRRTVRVPESFQGKHVWLVFGAVDWQAQVWVNGEEVGRHEGGYGPFEFDVTRLAEPGQDATIVVRAFDATDPELPRGKQGGSWFTPASGIWQTVYLEARPAAYVHPLQLMPVHRGQQWSLDVYIEAAGPDGEVQLELASPDATVPQHRAALLLEGGGGRLSTTLDVESPKLWTPLSPHLYDLEVRLRDAQEATDVVHTYFGLRTIERGKHGELGHETILLNSTPIYLRGALDQSFNAEGIYTAPSDDFIRRDMELAKEAGFNALRIHVKSEEPRRLYWADRLGLLVMEDMPCTFGQSPQARRAWEHTMRATILRDRNHPAILAWCLFNESWGLGGEAYKADTNTQDWVLRMVEEVQQDLDPSRLVVDNSPSLQDHVKTDLNSWHFCMEHCGRAREFIDRVVHNTHPESAFNYVPGRVQDTAPLITSKFGAISDRGGDHDVSWGLRCLITQLRRYELIQGYVYNGLCDIQWQRNGVVNDDRTAKEFGYEAFVPGMTLADLQGGDFVGYDGPPVAEVAARASFNLPVFVSHFSGRTHQPTLRWQIVGIDSLGRQVSTDAHTQRVVWERCRVTYQRPVKVRLPSARPLVGALTLELLDENEQRIAANFMNLIVGEASPLVADQPSETGSDYAYVEILARRLVAVRFAPGEFASFRADEVGWDWLDNRGKFYAYGNCEVEYHLALPQFVRDALPTEVVLMAELAAKAGGQELDEPDQRHLLDYPQTERRKYPGKAAVRLMDLDLWEFELPDDPADSRGVLSHRADYHSGSYGFLVRRKADLTKYVSLRETLSSEPYFPLAFRSADGHGLSIYGRGLGRYVVDPTLVIKTARDLTVPPGWSSSEPITIHALRKRSRLVHGVPSGDYGGHTWRYTTDQPPAQWRQPEFDDASWPQGTSPFGQQPPPSMRVRTPWTTLDIWLRTTITLPDRPVGMSLEYLHDDDVEIYVNGKELLRAAGAASEYRRHPVEKANLGLFRKGDNVIAVHCRRTQGGQAIDVGISWIEIEDTQGAQQQANW